MGAALFFSIHAGVLRTRRSRASKRVDVDWLRDQLSIFFFHGKPQIYLDFLPLVVGWIDRSEI